MISNYVVRCHWSDQCYLNKAQIELTPALFNIDFAGITAALRAHLLAAKVQEEMIASFLADGMESVSDFLNLFDTGVHCRISTEAFAFLHYGTSVDIFLKQGACHQQAQR